MQKTSLTTTETDYIKELERLCKLLVYSPDMESDKNIRQNIKFVIEGLERLRKRKADKKDERYLEKIESKRAKSPWNKNIR